MSQPSPLTPARQRAQAMADSGDRAGAVAMLAHAVELGKQNLGEDDPDVLAAAHQLARLHQDSDDPSAARRILEESYAAGQWRLGDADPLMLEISYDLGVVAEELGNRHEARKALTRVVEAGQPVLGDFHWAVQKSRAYLDGDTGVLREASAVVPDQRPPVPPLHQRTPPPPAPDEQRDTRPPLPRRQVQQAAPVRHEPAVEQMPVQQVPLQYRPPERTTPPQPSPPVQAEPDVWQAGPPVSGWDAWVAPPPVDLPPAIQRRARLGDEPTITQPRIVIPEHQPADHPVHRLGFGSEAPAPSPVSSSKGPAVFAAVAAVLAAVIAVAALVFVLADRGNDDGGGREDVPTLGGGPPPADLRVGDFGDKVEVSWSDPGEGRTSFIITGGHPGEVLKPMGEVGPGETSFTLQGLNDQLDYCFAVLAVYSTTEFASSAQSCTSRPKPAPSD